LLIFKENLNGILLPAALEKQKVTGFKQTAGVKNIKQGEKNIFIFQK